MTGPRVGSTVTTQTAPVLAEGAPPRARMLAVTLLCLLFGTRALDLLGGITFPNVTTSSYLQVLWTAALFLVPVLYAFPGPRQRLARRRWAVLVAQGALTWAPFVVFGSTWQVGVGGLLAGLVLLSFSGWASWLTAGSLLVADVTVRAAVTALPWEPAWSGALWAAIAFVDDGLAAFGIIWLTQLVDELQEAQSQAARFAAAAERLQAAIALQAAVDDLLSQVASKVAAAGRYFARDRARAAAEIASAGATAREAVARARQLPNIQETGVASYPSPASPRGSAVGARLAMCVVVAVVCDYGVAGINDAWGGLSARLMGVLIAGTLAV
ncbi:MAG TPA: hypothetical protein VME46_20930, partial [Acidimicrobiales bacterium]|nr:hypothetical protein [Acidimicrobiales bacterium]